MEINRPDGYNEYCKTLFELQQHLKSYEIEIRNNPKEKETYAAFNIQPENLQGEEWKQIGVTGYKKYECSNKGRVKYNGKIVPQKDISEKQVGYLVLDRDEYERTYTITDSRMTQQEFVYSLIAKAWLGKIDGDGYHVHHITNDGYDNSVENLVLLTAVEHSIIHGFKIGKC